MAEVTDAPRLSSLGPQSSGSPQLSRHLSPRQSACLHLAAQGLTSQEIGERLGISFRTVDQYIGEACERLGVRSRIHAVARAFALGLLTPGPP